MSNSESEADKRENAREGAGGQTEQRRGGAAKSSAQAVLGQKRRSGRLNKRLILGVIGFAVVGMLVLNFLPLGGKAKSGDGADAVYANDSMPMDVKEMAMKLPAAAPATTSGQSSFGRLSTVNNPFAGYPTSVTEPQATSARGGTPVAARDYQGIAAADSRLEAEQAARRAPMEVATKLTAGLAASGAGQSSNTGSQTAYDGPTSVAGSPQIPYSAQTAPLCRGRGSTPGRLHSWGDLSGLQRPDNEGRVLRAESRSCSAERGSTGRPKPSSFHHLCRNHHPGGPGNGDQH